MQFGQQERALANEASLANIFSKQMSEDPVESYRAASMEAARLGMGQEAMKLRNLADTMEMKISGAGGPASIQETKWFMNQPQDVQGVHERLKRAQQTLNLGGQQVVLDPRGGVRERYDVTPKPDHMPAFQGAQERAKATAKAAVGMEEEFAKKGIKAQNMNDLITEARANLNDASGSYIGAGLSVAKSGLGISDKKTQANRKLKLIGGWMVSNVPRMEGPQSDFDVKNYREMAAMVGDSTAPIEDRLAALGTLEQLQAKYAGGANTSQGGNKPIVVDW